MNTFLSKFVASGELKDLICAMNLEVHKTNEILFQEGDAGDKFYIIYEGSVGISIQGKGMVSELKKGDSFGELSLLFAQPRSGTATILEQTDLISLSRDSYNMIIKEIHSTLGSEHFSFLRKVPIFSKMSQLSAKYLTQIAQLRKYSTSSIITSQGEATGFVHLIYSGSVKLYKDMEFRDSKSNEIESLVKTVGSQDIKQMKRVFLQEVHQGYIIGAYEFFYHIPMQYTAVCSMSSLIFIFDKYIFEKVDLESIEQFKKTLKPYVCDRILKENYFEDIRWKIYKKKLIKNIKIQKAIENKRFLTERSPITMPTKNLALSTIRLPKLASSRSKTQPKIRKPTILPIITLM